VNPEPFGFRPFGRLA